MEHALTESADGFAFSISLNNGDCKMCSADGPIIHTTVNSGWGVYKKDGKNEEMCIFQT